MLEFPDRYRLPPLALQAAAAVALSAVLAGVSIFLSPLWAILGVVAVAAGLVLLQRLELAPLLIIAAMATVVAPEQLPGISVLHVVDVAMAGLVALVVVRLIAEPDFTLVQTPLNVPLLVFLALAALSGAVALLGGSVEAWALIDELAVMSYYLLFFVVTHLIRTRCQLNWLLYGFFGLTAVVSVMMGLQYALGDIVTILPGRVETLVTQGETFAGVTRILPPGQILQLVGVVTLSALLGTSSRYRWLLLGLLGLAVLGLLVTFLRSYWLGAGIAGLLILVLAYPAAQERLLRAAALAAVGAAIVLAIGLAAPSSPVGGLVEGVVDRMATLVDDDSFTDDATFLWRNTEYEYAVPQLNDTLLLGIGMGAEYRPLDARIDTVYDPNSNFFGTRYLHNGHLWIALKAGGLAYLALATLSLIYIVRGVVRFRTVRDPIWQGVALGFPMAYVAILIATINGPTFMQTFGPPVIALMMGANEVIYRLSAAEPVAEPAPMP